MPVLSNSEGKYREEPIMFENVSGAQNELLIYFFTKNILVISLFYFAFFIK